jgi:hypothetical protein
LTPDLTNWREKSWWHQLSDARTQIAEMGNTDEPFILVDEDKWGFPEEFLGRKRLWLAERDAEKYSHPEDDAQAIADLERQIEHGARLLIIAEPAFWYLEEYPRFMKHVRTNFKCIRENDRLVAFDLRNAN